MLPKLLPKLMLPKLMLPKLMLPKLLLPKPMRIGRVNVTGTRHVGSPRC